MKMIRIALAALLLSACAEFSTAVLPQSPESQIAAGANALTTATTVTTVALRNDKITTIQAKNYSAMLHAAGNSLDDANAALLKCRTATGSNSATNPDPCKQSVVTIIQLALDSIANVKRTVDAVK